MTQGSTKGVPIDTDPTMAANSNQLVPSQAAVVTFVGAQVATKVASVSGTLNRITSTGGLNPVIDISASYVGQASITTLGTIGTGTWAATTITVDHGGTGTVTNTDHGVLIGRGTAAIEATAAGTAGQVLQSGGAAANPLYSTPTYPSTSGSSGKILVSDGTNNIYSTPTFPNASASSGKFIRSDGTNWIASTPTLPTSAGAAGKVLISDATNYVESTPTFPNASATSRKIIVSDGTNWVASTETWAVPGTSGNVLTSNGTNWTSAASGSAVTQLTGTLTNSQIKNLHGTPVQVLAAPGAGSVIQLVAISAKMIYGGTNVFTAGSSQLIRFYYGTTTSAGNALSNAQIVASATQFQTATPVALTVANTTVSNIAINLYNDVAVEIGGNAANNNTVSWSILYRIVTI